jgi:hypothetical protein
VVAVNTPTLTPLIPTPTETPVIYASGTLQLFLNETIDLDSGLINQADQADLVYQEPSGGQPLLALQNGARVSLAERNAPELADCKQAETGDGPVDLSQYRSGSYLCYRTSQGLPGRFAITEIDLSEGLIRLEFITWAVP